MPTYEYVCDACNHTFDLFQSMKDPVKRKCPKCGKAALRRLIGTGAALLFKGSGFYETDYRSESYKKAQESETKPTETKPAENKPADANAAAAAPAPDSKSSGSKTADTMAATAKHAEAKPGAAKSNEAKPAEPQASESRSGKRSLPSVDSPGKSRSPGSGGAGTGRRSSKR